MAEINTNIALTNTEATIYKKIKNLSNNETPLAQGDAILRISPFDDYVMFTLYSEIDGVDVPIDLTNTGTLYLVFIGSNDEIRIPNYTNVEDIDLTSGQVLFRISKDDSKKILALNDNNFYISSKMVDSTGESDESVVYTGKFLSFTQEATQSLTSQIDDLRVEYSKEISKLQETVNSLNADITERNNQLAEQSILIDSLRKNNENLLNEITDLNELLSTNITEEYTRRAAEIQKQEDELKKKVQQMQANAQAVTDTKKKSFYENAHKNLRKNFTDVNPVTQTETVETNPNVTPPPPSDMSRSTGGGGGSGGGKLDLDFDIIPA